MTQTWFLPKLDKLPGTLPDDGAITIVIQDGAPVFRASNKVQRRIERLLSRQETVGLAAAEEEELDRYEEIDDYLSHLNRLVRNLLPG